MGNAEILQITRAAARDAHRFSGRDL